MKILFIAPSYKPAYIYGGPVVVIALLAESLVKLGHLVTVYTTTANGKSELDMIPGTAQIVDGVEVFYFKRITGDHTHISPALWRKLNKQVKEFDAVHLHSWWNVLILGAALICKKNKVIPVISPHGMFSNYILKTNNSNIKKWTQGLIGKKILRNTILHVSTDMEWDESQKVVPGWKGMIIPNLVTLSEKNYERHSNQVFTIGFLSRIDPKKGLDLLIKALGTIDFPYKLLVAGSGEIEYVESLKALSKQIGISSNIEWVGWKNGEDKFKFLANLDMFALTSHSENFAIVVIESLSVGTPVLISDQVGLFSYVKKNDYGWVGSNDVNNIQELIITIYKENEKRYKIRHDVPEQIRSEYKPTKLAAQYFNLYSKYRTI
ncbi:XrtY-associated glycosyltransferase XYAG1 [Mucilaginibacter sp. UYCu711]|uniref:XrtY-associated glycosyltransferase XYAG1 n=1 Tax=Mucilaginibacter sp. UYCu711 TaxID=3156339 RepID=UPI003D1D2702